MRTKKEVYKSEQFSLSNKIIDILELDINNQISLYCLDRDPNKIKQIMDLIPDLRKYFSFRNMVGIQFPEKLKRPWLSIIRHITKLTHHYTCDHKYILVDDKYIKTPIYTFIRK